MPKRPDSAARLSFFSRFFHSRSLYINILTAFLGLLLLTTLTIVFYNYRTDSRVVRALSHRLLRRVTERVIEKARNYLRPVSTVAEFSARLAREGKVPLTGSEDLERYGIEILRILPHVSMVNMGDEQGNFLMPKRLPDGGFATKRIDRSTQPPRVTWTYRDADLRVTKIEEIPYDRYDPRLRPWYQGAKASKGHFWTDVYIFFTDQKPGITASYPVLGPDGTVLGVFGLDIELGELSEFLKALRIGKRGVALIINDKDEVVAFPDISRTAKEEDGKWRPFHVDELGEPSITAALTEHRSTGARKSLIRVGRSRYMASFTLFPESFQGQWEIAVVVPEDDFLGPLKRASRVALLICLIVLGIAGIVATALSRSISRPIIQLSEETEKIKSFQLDEKTEIRSVIREIQLMSHAISSMKTGLKAFRKYVPAELVRQLIRTGEEARLGGRKRELTILFSDIAGFTTTSENLSPENLMVHLSEYLDEVTSIVIHEKGTVDKYIGDAVMAFWGAPVADDNHALHACQAALLCQKRIDELNEKWNREGKPPLPTRIGVNTGETIVGNMGSRERMNYTVLGDSVNLASRLEGVNKYYGTRIIVSESTYEKVAESFLFRPLDIVAVKGKTQGITIYELVAKRDDDLSPQKEQLCERFTKGVEAYLNRDWDGALRIFEQILEISPSDAATTLYRERCVRYKEDPPGPEWDGIVRMETK